MRIDVHAHYWTEDYIDLLVDLGQAGAVMTRGLGAGDGAELDARLRLMDRAGVDMQVLSACPQLPYGEDGQKAAETARFVNDQYARLVQRYPDRFRAFAALPMPHIEESIAEMGRALDPLGMAGVAMNTTVLDRALVEPEYEPIFAELNRRSAVLYLHPAGNGACTPLISNYHMTWMAGAPVEDTISVMHLIRLGSTRHARATKRCRPPDVVRHRRPRTRSRSALRDRLARGGPAPARNRLPLRERGHLRPRDRLHPRSSDRRKRRPGHP